MLTQLAAGPSADAELDVFACAVGRRDQSVEERGSVCRVIPGESEGFVRESKGEIDPVKSTIVDLLRGKRVRRPVWIVSHYESVFGGERGRQRTSHVKKRSGTREKPKEGQGRHRNNKRIHIKKNRRVWIQPAHCEGELKWEEERN